MRWLVLALLLGCGPAHATAPAPFDVLPPFGQLLTNTDPRLLSIPPSQVLSWRTGRAANQDTYTLTFHDSDATDAHWALYMRFNSAGFPVVVLLVPLDEAGQHGEFAP